MIPAAIDRPSACCPACGGDVPAGMFCGRCGARLAPRRGDRPAWLRPSAFCVAPNESVFRPSPASSLLPHLSALTRTPLNVGVLVIVAALAILAQAQLPGGLITVAALGLPLLLSIYWWRAGVLAGLPRWAVGLTAVLAIGIAIGWVVLTDDLVVRQAGSAFDAGSAGRRVLRDGFGVAEGGALLMLVPAVIVRLLWRSRRESLDGFVIGVLSALLFTSTATLTRLAPQLLTAPVARNEPVRWLMFEAAVRGVAVPITAACAGGLVGAALWFTRTKQAGRPGRLAVAFAVGLCATVVLAVYALVGRADIEGVTQWVVLSWHIAMAIVALIALRVGVQLALLHERQDPYPEGHLRCPNCRTLQPAMAFCPDCGAATRAGVRVAASPAPGPVRVTATWLVTITAICALVIGMQALVVKAPPRYNCPPDCGRPPSGTPVAANPRFTPPGGQYSVAYPDPGSNYAVTIDDTGVTARFTAGDGGVMRLTGEPAAGRTAQQVARAYLASKFPTAQFSYEIPNAKLGFAPGYGEVADVFPNDLDTRFTRTRVIVIAAVKDDYALIAGGAGPYRQFGPDSGPGRPSPANVQIAEDMGRYVNSFMWAGDPPR